MNFDEHPEHGCDNCGYETGCYKFRTHAAGASSPFEEDNFYFCEVCSSTMLSNAEKYPDQCSDPDLYKAIGWIANHS